MELEKAVEGLVAMEEVCVECVGCGSMAMGSWSLVVELMVVVCYDCKDGDGREGAVTRGSEKEMVIRVD